MTRKTITIDEDLHGLLEEIRGKFIASQKHDMDYVQIINMMALLGAREYLYHRETISKEDWFAAAKVLNSKDLELQAIIDKLQDLAVERMAQGPTASASTSWGNHK